MSRPPAAVAVVAGSGDGLGEAVARALEERGRPVVRAEPDRLAELPATLADGTFRLDGRPVGAILFRAPPNAAFSDGFVDEDRGFCDAEARAVWLAAMHLGDVLALNRLPPWAWFGSAGWADWRRAMAAAHVPVAPFTFGAPADDSGRRSPGYWYTYGGTRPQPAPGAATRRALGAALTAEPRAHTCLAVCGRVVAGDPPPAGGELVERLRGLGLEIVSLSADLQGRVLALDPLPSIRQGGAVERAATLLEKRIDAHLRGR